MKLTGALPNGNADGLSSITEQMVDDPSRVWAVVALVDCKRLTTDLDTGDVEPTARIRHIEVVQGQDNAALAERIMSRSLAARTGREVLPLDLEDQIAEAFKGVKVDPSTGEVLDED